jgi:hypothetical protein
MLIAIIKYLTITFPHIAIACNDDILLYNSFMRNARHCSEVPLIACKYTLKKIACKYMALRVSHIFVV